VWARRTSFVTAGEFHLGAHRKPIALCCLQANQEPVITIDGMILVQQKANRSVVIRNYNVYGTIIVNVAKRCAAAHLGEGENGPSRSPHVAELLAFALIVKQQIGLPKRVWSTPRRPNPVHSAIGKKQV
jgi:hypothetical protein